MRDADAMRAALDAAYGARRRVAPWPHVGAVIVRHGEVVGIGATGSFPQGPHAEVAALAEAADRAVGATLVTTLEPCNHHGNTPPCTEAILAAGVSRVVVALTDPDPKVAGSGLARLTAAGIEVDVGVGADLVADQLWAYLHHRRTGRAATLAKVATSLDGRIAAADGSSRWITGAEARADAHGLRADSQAIVVGAGTVLADDPELTVRDAGGPEMFAAPLRVLLDARGRVPATVRLADTSVAPTLIVTTPVAPESALAPWRERGCEVVTVDFAENDRGSGVDLVDVLELLGGRGVLQAMVEGGAYLHGALFDAGLVDRVVAYVGNTLLGAEGLAGYGLGGPKSIADAARFGLRSVRQLGDDVRLEYTPERGRDPGDPADARATEV
jgi:diaminohydroxyphosphoribosylaminopyrimidine deaminase/5-amino-6-(5-phosphoribosylamino)uracil reductase